MKHHRQGGFTLVEIAIVLVIIGLLLGGVLKGQELIENARIKQVVNDYNGIAAAVYAYQDRYNALPGDDPLATPAGRGWADSVAGNGNGVIGDPNSWTACAAATAGEECLFWRHLRHANLISGAPNNAAAQNAYRGQARVTQSAGAQTGAPSGLLLCQGNLPGKAAVAVDVALDDGAPNTGTTRGRQGADNLTPYGGAAAGYLEPQAYTVCRRL